MAKPTNQTQNSNTQESAEALLLPSTVLNLKIAWKDVEPVYKHVLHELSARVKAPGFRKGKVPAALAKDIIGPEKLLQETAQHLLPAEYDKLIKTSGKFPIAQPEFEPKKMGPNQDWEFEVKIAERATVAIKGLAKLVKKAKSDAEKALAEEAKKPAETDKKDAKNAVSKPALTESERKERVMQEVLRTLITSYKPRVPELLLKQETRYELEEMVRSLEQLKMTLQDYLNRRRIQFDELSNEVAVQTLGKLQLDLLYGSIIDDQKITVSDKDLDTFVERITDEKQRAEQRKNQQYLSYITPIILRQKVSDYLLSL